MNRYRRKALDDLRSQLEEIQVAIEAVRDEEQEAYDNLPESLQEGERGQAMSEAIDNLDSTSYSLGEVIDSLEEATT